MPASLAEVKAAKLLELRALRAEFDRREQVRLANLDVFKLLGYEPTCKPRVLARMAGATFIPEPCGQCPQELFHAATESDVLYGGAAGGGKSAALVAEGIRACAKHPGLRVLLVRRTYDELNESIFPALRKYEYASAVGARYNGTDRELVFPNRSIFRFRYLESLDDASRRQGGEYQLLLVDELTLMSPGVVDILRYERLRAAGGVPVIGVRATTNPGGPSHGEVKARYIDSTESGTKVVTDEHGLTVRFVQAKATDNPHLDAAYHARLASIPDPARRAAMRDGRWDLFAGMVFTEWSFERHTMDPITLPASWPRYNGIDWGFTSPWAVLWGAVDEDDRIWIYRELYERDVGEAEQAGKILAAEEPGERVVGRFADDSMWDPRGDAKYLSEAYADHGVYLTKAGKGPGSRISGWQRIHYYLGDGPACPHHRAQGLPTCPRIHIFRQCKGLIAELPSLPYSKIGNPEDVDQKAVDHASDALRYLLLNVGVGPDFPILGEIPGTQFAEQLHPLGPYAVRQPDDGLPWAWGDEDDTPRATVQRSPFA